MLEKDFLEAIVKGDSQRVVRLLGQITDTGPVKDGRNALHLAAQYGNADIVSVLLLSGLYDCNTPDSIGYTALQIAAAEGYLEIVKQLIKAGSNVNSADNVHGNTALHEAAWKGYSRTVAEITKTKANLNVKNWGGFTPLHLCCQNGHNQSCRELLLAGCDPNVQNNYGDTPLHTSARYGHAGVMRILISAQCHISDQNKNGDTALHIAAAMNQRKLTRILLESHCDKTILNKQNENAEDIAIRKSLKEVLDILRNPITVRKKEKSSGISNCKATNKKVNKKSSNKVRSDDKKNVTYGNVAIPWSPYGCHYHPESKEFPEPNLDSLPHEPLRKGEQYYLDLAGNIRKGPVGVGYACYCAPLFSELEARIEKKTKKIKKQISRTEEAINKRLNTLEYCIVAQKSKKLKSSLKNSEYKNVKEVEVTEDSLYRTRSLESIFDVNDDTAQLKDSHKNIKQYLNVEKRKNILYFPDNDRKNFTKTHNSNCSSPYSESNKRNLDLNCNRKNYSPSFDTKLNGNLWKSSNLAESDSCQSTDEECEKGADIRCNDSGYSTKLCSNSQGPSPSLSGRLENDGLISTTPSQEEKHVDEINTYITSFQNISLKHASVV